MRVSVEEARVVIIMRVSVEEAWPVRVVRVGVEKVRLQLVL